MDTNKVIADLNTAFGEFKTANEARLKAIESKGYAPADVEEKVSKLNNTISDLEGQIKKMQTAMNKAPVQNPGDGEKSEKQLAYEKAFKGYLRKGGSEAEVKALSADSQEDGGLLITPEMSSEIVKKVYETSDIRKYASVQTIGSSSLQILEDLDEAGGGHTSEIALRGETTTPKFNQIEIPVHEIYAEPKATQTFLDDASINVESWLAGKVAEKFARIENAAFVSGSGAGKAKGFLAYADGTGFGQVQQVEGSTSLSIVADDMINLFYELKTAYVSNAKWFMNRQIIKKLRLLKDTQGKYLWAPGLDGNASGTFLGHEIVEFADMSAALTAGTLSVAWGDMKQAYQIVDRIGIRTLRDPFTAKPFVKFYTTKRYGGGVKNFEALKLLKIKA